MSDAEVEVEGEGAAGRRRVAIEQNDAGDETDVGGEFDIDLRRGALGDGGAGFGLALGAGIAQAPAGQHLAEQALLLGFAAGFLQDAQHADERDGGVGRRRAEHDGAEQDHRRHHADAGDDAKATLINYNTSINIMALSAVNKGDKYKAVIGSAAKYLKEYFLKRMESGRLSGNDEFLFKQLDAKIKNKILSEVSRK